MRQGFPGRIHLPLRAASFRASLVVCAVVALCLLIFSRANLAVFDHARQAVDGATSSFYGLVSPPIETARHFFSNAARIFDVYAENERLREENAELRAWRDKAEVLQQKVTRYEALLGMPLEPDIEYRTGRVLDDPGGPFVRTLRVNLGRKNGVHEGEAVIDDHGLVGRLVASGASASRVLLITDLNSRIPVKIEPSGARAMLIGQNDQDPVIAYLPRDSRVEVGNEILSSGSGGFIPPDIPVGRVVAVSGDHITVAPAVAFDSVNYVRVLDYHSPVADVPDRTSGPPILSATPPGEPPPAPAANTQAPKLGAEIPPKKPAPEEPPRSNETAASVVHAKPVEATSLPPPPASAPTAPAHDGGFE